MPDTCLVYVTVPSENQAMKIAHAVVKQRLAACANVISGMKSVYWWEGKLESGDEVVLLLKTQASLVEKLTHTVKELHEYECPCVVALPISQGNHAFLQWIVDETTLKP